MAGTSFVNRLWFNQNKIGWTIRADYVTNPGGYLAFSPAQRGITPNDYETAISEGEKIKMCQLSTTFDFMPSDFITFRIEYAYRNANIPYFTGPGGTTSQTGFSNDTLDPDWKADLKKSENRIILAVNFRL